MFQMERAVQRRASLHYPNDVLEIRLRRTCSFESLKKIDIYDKRVDKSLPPRYFAMDDRPTIEHAQVLEKTATALLFGWEKPKKFKKSNEVIQYLTEYKEAATEQQNQGDAAQVEDEWTPVEAEVTECSAKKGWLQILVSGLLPSTTYEIRVTARSGDIIGPPSPPVFATTEAGQ